jgi:hypothetical protein
MPVSNSCSSIEVENCSGILKYKAALPKIIEEYQAQFRDFEGAIIDLESDGAPFIDYLEGAYQYSKHSATSFGILDEDSVEVIAKTCRGTQLQFVNEIEQALEKRDRPYFAFNTEFDMAILSKLLEREIIFDGDIMVERVKKEIQVRNFGISNFDDPFNGNGGLAGFSWKRHLETKEIKHVQDIMAHNRACVLKEYSLLLHVGFRPIEKSSCNGFFDGKNELFFGCRKKL